MDNNPDLPVEPPAVEAQTQTSSPLHHRLLTGRNLIGLGVVVILLGAGILHLILRSSNNTNVHKQVAQTTHTANACVAPSDDRYYRTDRSLVIDPQNPQNLFIGVEYKGAYQSTDGGTTWKQTMQNVHWTNGCFPEPFYAASSPADPNTLYLSTNGNGILKTTDSGRNWKKLYSSAMYPRSEAFAFDPINAQTIYATAENTRSASTNPQDISNVTKGLVYKSVNGGSTWTELTTPLAADAGDNAIIVSKQDPHHLLAFTLLLKYDKTTNISTEANGRQPDISGQLGILESKDAGTTWNSLHTIPNGYEATTSAFYSSANPNNIYITPFTAGNVPPEGFFSTDFGRSWSPSRYMSYVAYDPFDATGNHAIGFTSQGPPGTTGQLLETNDAGKTWQPYAKLPAEITDASDHKTLVSDIQWDPKDPHTLYLTAASALVWKSTDSGKTWDTLLSLSKIQ